MVGDPRQRGLGPFSQRVAVVGGGISGLAAAHALSRTGANVVLYEASSRLGGKIRTATFRGARVELGPDAFITRTLSARALAERLGLAEELVAPQQGRAYLWARGGLREIPRGSIFGVPTKLYPVARSGILGPVGLARLGLDRAAPAWRSWPSSGGKRLDGQRGRISLGQVEEHLRSTIDRDMSIGAIIRWYLGAEAMEQLVDPLLGGIHAGSADHLSAAALFPQILRARELAERSGSGLMRALVGLQAAAPPPPGRREPLFLTIESGLDTLVRRVVDDLGQAGAAISTGRAVERIEQAEGGAWRLFAAGGRRGGELVDGLVLATPAAVTSRLLSPHSPVVARLLGSVPSASVAVVTLCYRRAAISRPRDGSGFLVPAANRKIVTGVTWLSQKWRHIADCLPGFIVIRASVGRFLQPRGLDLDDPDLVAAVHDELGEFMGLRERPIDSLVTRWNDAFPQYLPGHPAMLEQIRRDVEPLHALALCGASFGGVGIPACIASGERAAAHVSAALSREVGEAVHANG